MPRVAIRLGFLGLTPLAISALISLSRHEGTALLGGMSFAIYAAVLLSFMGGARCGFELMRAPEAPSGLRLTFSALPALGGWLLALLVIAWPGAMPMETAFAGLFALQQVWDRRSAADAGAPAWYPALRQVLTGGAMVICLLIPLASVLNRL
jgi:hypothetical protein